MFCGLSQTVLFLRPKLTYFPSCDNPNLDFMLRNLLVVVVSEAQSSWVISVLHASVYVFVGERGTLRIVNAFPRNVSTVPHLKMIASTTLLEGHVACGLRRRLSPRRTSKDSEAQMEVTCTNRFQKHM